MILVDSSVWVEYLRGHRTEPAEMLDRLLGVESLLIGDLVLAEVLQGCSSDRDFASVRRFLEPFEVLVIGGADVAVEAAHNFRRLRNRGMTIRGTIDTIIATRCIMSGIRLLHSDRDFEPFERYLGLKTVN